MKSNMDDELSLDKIDDYNNKESKQKNELKIDLNLPPPEDDNAHHQSNECEMHNPGCIHWNTIPSDKKGKLYHRWI